MAMVNVKFERFPGAGVVLSGVDINQDPLDFGGGNTDTKQLEVGKPFEARWKFSGSPGSAFTLKFTVEGVTKTVVENDKIPQNHLSKENYRFITL